MKNDGYLDLLSPASDSAVAHDDFSQWMLNWVALTEQLELNTATGMCVFSVTHYGLFLNVVAY